MLDNSNENDRREYFRIKNWVILNYTAVESLNLIPKESSPPPSNSPHITLLQELACIESDNQAYLSSLENKTSHVSNYVVNLNKKIELLTRFVVQLLDREKQDLTEVDLSGGGIRFSTSDKLDIDQILKIEMVLVPDCVGIVAYCRVVDSQLNSKNQYNIALEFVQLKESDRDAIIRHIFKLQSQQLRAQQEKSEKN